MKQILWFSLQIWLQNARKSFLMDTLDKLIDLENHQKIILQYGILDLLIQPKTRLLKVILNLPMSAYYRPNSYLKIMFY